MMGYFILVAVIDIEHRLIIGQISLVGVILGAAVGILLHAPWITLLGGIAGAGIMFVLYQMGRLFSMWVSRKREEPVAEEALGFGDVYIAGIIGLILGWPGITAGLFLAILVGGLISGLSLVIMLLLKKYQPFMALPYAPFLLLAATVLLYRP
jgi:leader peptidase (prepilin peptidase)/N-methyltransferase